MLIRWFSIGGLRHTGASWEDLRCAANIFSRVISRFYELTNRTLKCSVLSSTVYYGIKVAFPSKFISMFQYSYYETLENCI